MKTIRDPIHGDIELSATELAVVDTEALQRLRRIKQLSFCSLVYPGANHTRFEHALGTMHLAGRIARRLDLEPELIRLAGLIHDAGHLPFSHSLENVFNVNHEDNLKIVLKGNLGDVLNNHGYHPNELLKLVKGNGLGTIIASQIDADRIDYLLRDSHYTGVAYGVVDADRIINVMGFKDSLYFEKKGLIALESLLIGRNQMYEAVYFHHTVRIADAMLQEAISQIKCDLKVGDLLKMGDEELKLFAMKKSPVAKELLGLLDRRELYKVACSVTGKVDRKKLADKTGLPLHKVLVSQTRVGKIDFSIPVEENGKLKKINVVSDIAKNLENEIKKLELTEVCVPERFKEKVSACF